jgi:hypothetical protein
VTHITNTFQQQNLSSVNFSIYGQGLGAHRTAVLEGMVMPKVVGLIHKGCSHQILQGRVSSGNLNIEIPKHPVAVV